MRRPAAFLCSAYILGIILEACFKLTYISIFIIAIICLFAMIVGMHFYKNSRHKFYKKTLCLFFVAIILLTVGALQYNHDSNKVGKLEKLNGEYLTLQGKVVSIIEKDKDKYQMIVDISKIENFGKLKRKEKILVNIYENVPEYHKFPGKNIKIKGFVELPSVRRNPKTFDYRIYLKTKKIATIMNAELTNIQPSKKIYSPYLNKISEIKYTFKRNLYNLFDDNIAGLLMGMIFGDNSGLSQELYDTFQKNGACHILAVSGLHIGALYICINSLLGGKRKIKYYIFIIIVLFFYASLANFSSSVTRAVMMIILHIISKYTYSRYDMFTSGMLTMAFMLFFNPISILNLGFQLSYIAIFTLAVVLPAAERIYKKPITTIFVIQAGISPISAYAFNYFSYSAFIANIPIVFIAGILIPLGMLLLIISTVALIIPECSFVMGIFDFLFQVLGISIEFLCKVLLFINNIAFIEGFSYKYVTSPSLWLVFLYYSLLFFISSEFFRIIWQRKYYKKILYFIILIFCTTFILGNSLNDGFEDTQFIFIDVGQGDCLLIKTSDGKNVLIDSGGSSRFDVGKKTLLPCLLKNGVDKIDMAIITHFHTDHFGGLCSLSKEIPIKKLGLYEVNSVIADEIQEEVGINKKDFIYLTKDDKLEIGKELQINILYPKKRSLEEYSELIEKQEDENALCLVMKINYKGLNLIMNGDIGFEAENSLLKANNKILKTDILKVAHHGSKYGSSKKFLQSSQPKIAIIQVGKNNYGHPNQDTLRRLEDIGAIIYRNDLQGAIGVEIKKRNEIEIHTMI